MQKWHQSIVICILLALGHTLSLFAKLAAEYGKSNLNNHILTSRDTPRQLHLLKAIPSS